MFLRVFFSSGGIFKFINFDLNFFLQVAAYHFSKQLSHAQTNITNLRK